jgi:hypothetical protein
MAFALIAERETRWDTAGIEIKGLYIEVRYGGLATQLICCIVGLKSMP